MDLSHGVSGFSPSSAWLRIREGGGPYAPRYAVPDILGEPVTDLDPRLNAYRPDLAASALRGQVQAARFVDGRPALVACGLADLRRRPEAAAALDTQLMFGETVTVYDQADGWAWVQNAEDEYVGYVEAACLREAAPGVTLGVPSHYLKVLRSFLYPEADLKAPPLEAIGFMSPLRVLGTRDRFSEVGLPGGGSGWVFSAHLAEAADTAPDYVATANLFLGVPYLWGGRSGLGLDCSALVQLVLARAGVPCARDSGVQATSVGRALDWHAGTTRLQRGDLVYFPGHCAIALNDTEILHANAGSMLTAIEPLSDVVERVEAESGGRGVTGVRRIVP